MAYAGAVVAVAALSYSVYSGQQAQKAQAAAQAQAQQEFQQQQATQSSQYQQQQAAEAATTAQNLATEQQTQTQTTQAQQSALAAEQAAIGTNSTTLSNSLSAQENQAMTAQQPLIQDQLNQGGLADSGAYAAQLAKYQAGLASQAQTTLANYQVGAQGQLTQDTTADSASQVQMDQANALLNIQNGEQNMSQNFATQNADNQNTTAYQQYLMSLQQAGIQSQQSQANAYAGFGAQLGSGMMNYYGNQNNTLNQNAAMQALLMQQNINGYGNQSYVNSNSYNPGATNASNNNYSGFA